MFRWHWSCVKVAISTLNLTIVKQNTLFIPDLLYRSAPLRPQGSCVSFFFFLPLHPQIKASTAKVTSGELAGSDSSCFACILATQELKSSYLFHFIEWFLVSSTPRPRPPAPGLQRAQQLQWCKSGFLCWLNEHIRSLSAVGQHPGPSWP